MTASTTLTAAGISVTLEHDCGILLDLIVERDGRRVAMLHEAPWRGEIDSPSGDPARLLPRLAGDFFCAPFYLDAPATDAPVHGWPANGLWSSGSTEGGTTTFVLGHGVMSGTLEKRLTLKDHHPFVYQSHDFRGGRGAISAANHANLILPVGGLISRSPKRWFETPAAPLETDPALGRSLVASAARSTDPTTFPRADGGTLDLTRYPLAADHEDFVVGVEAEGRDFGWTTVYRPDSRDLYISLRNARQLPLSMNWFSNGGRFYEPWSSRHKGVLGVEEGVSRSMLGWSAAQAKHPLDAAGTATALTLDPNGTVKVRHVIGEVPWAGSGRIVSVEPMPGELVVIDVDGTTARLAYDETFLRHV